ncbi:MAG: hypothetical protein NC311_15995, partial [Muribaculaceae bacterium]|nr:hypothetical protein [Muribaculaceae bacterium]
MILTLRLIDNLEKLLRGEPLPYSAIPRSISDSLVREGLLTIEFHGTRRLLRVPNKTALMSALPRFNEALTDIDTAKRILTGDDSRAAQAGLSGNSKIRSKRSCPGFLVNSFSSLQCTLDGIPFSVNPPEGSAVYIANWESFVPPTTALIVGVENMENFLMIRKQRALIESFMKSEETGILFVARYALSSDLTEWLRIIPNRYLHFGDFDLAGIDIFLTQFLPAVGDRGSFLIPSDIESRISLGSRHRYDEQYSRYANLTTTDPDLTRLLG